jgi:hypothetical protein
VRARACVRACVCVCACVRERCQDYISTRAIGEAAMPAICEL